MSDVCALLCAAKSDWCTLLHSIRRRSSFGFGVFLSMKRQKKREKIYHSIHIYCNDTRKKREREIHPADVIDVWNSHGNPNYIYQHFCLSLSFSLTMYTHSTVYTTHTYTYRYARREYVCSCVCAVYLVEWAERKQTLSQNPAIQWMELILDGWMRFILFHFIFCYSSFESIKHTHTRPDERESS